MGEELQLLFGAFEVADVLDRALQLGHAITLADGLTGRLDPNRTTLGGGHAQLQVIGLGTGNRPVDAMLEQLAILGIEEGQRLGQGRIIRRG